MSVVYYWSSEPGDFVDKKTGKSQMFMSSFFTGVANQWYESLFETLVDLGCEVCNVDFNTFYQLDRGKLKVYVNNDILEMLYKIALFRFTQTKKDENGELVGVINSNIDVYLNTSLPKTVAIFSYNDEKIGTLNVLKLNNKVENE